VRGLDLLGQPARHRETIDTGQPDVEQHDVRPQRADGVDRGRPVTGLADDLEALGLEQGPRLPPEGGMVVDDQERGHERMLAR